MLFVVRYEVYDPNAQTNDDDTIIYFNKMNKRHQWLPSLILIILTITDISRCTSSNNYFTVDRIKSFIKSRCSNDNDSDKSSSTAGIWAYEGQLSDPFTGKIIAHCEGLELVRALGGSYSNTSRQATVTATETSNNNRLPLWNKLTTGKILQSSDDWEYAATYLSRKIFCYLQPKEGNENKNESIAINTTDNENSNNPRLLQSIRLTNQGKVRHLAASESVALYDNAVTFVSRGGEGKGMAVITEWPVSI